MLALLLSVACVTEPHDGTFVGNPGNLTAEVSEVSEDIDLQVAELDIVEIAMWGCDGSEVIEPLDRVVSVVDPDWSVTAPEDGLCGVEIVTAKGTPLYLEGQTDGGLPFVGDLDLGVLFWEGQADAASDHTLQIPLGILTEAFIEELELDSYGTAVFDKADAVVVSGSIEDNLALHSDPIQGLSTDTEDADSQNSCGGCATGNGAGGWLLALLGLAALRRRTHSADRTQHDGVS